MTVETLATISGPYTADGAQTSWPFTFRVDAPAQVRIITESPAGVRAVIVPDTVTVVLTPTPGGNVTRATPVPYGFKVWVARETPATQTTSFKNQAEFFPEKHERAFDKLTLAVQEVREDVERSVRIPRGATQGEINPAADDGAFLVVRDGRVKAADGGDLVKEISKGVVDAAGAVADARIIERSPYDILAQAAMDHTFKRGDYELQGNSGDNTDGNALQNHFYDEKNGHIYGWAETGTSRRVCRWSMNDTNYTRLPIDSASLSGITGHSGGGIEYVGGGSTVKLWSGGQTSYADGQGNVWYRFDYVPGMPPQNVQTFKLFPAGYGVSAGCISKDKKWLVAYAFQEASVAGKRPGIMRVFDLAALVAAGPGDRSNMAAYSWPLDYPSGKPKQGFACHEDRIFIASGGLDLTDDKLLQVFHVSGNLGPDGRPRPLLENHQWNPGRWQAVGENFDSKWENEGLDFLYPDWPSTKNAVLTTCMVSGGTEEGHDRHRRIFIFGPGAAEQGNGKGWNESVANTSDRWPIGGFAYDYVIHGTPLNVSWGNGAPFFQRVFNAAKACETLEACLSPDGNDAVRRIIFKSRSGKPGGVAASGSDVVDPGGNLSNNDNIFQEDHYGTNASGKVVKAQQFLHEVNGTPGDYIPVGMEWAWSKDGSSAPSRKVFWGASGNVQLAEATAQIGIGPSNTRVIKARMTGWAVDTGTAKRTANATYSRTFTAPAAFAAAGASYVQATQTAVQSRIENLETEVAALTAALRDATQTIKALKDDLHATAGHGLIGA